MNITKLDDDSSETIEIVTLQEIERDLSIYSNRQLFREWMTTNADTLPKPYMKVNGSNHWLKSQAEEFKTQWQAYLKELSDERVKELSKETITKIQLLTALAEYAKRIERSNSRCYKNARGSSSMNAGRLRIKELEGAIEFTFRALGGFDQIPHVLRAETHKYLREAKNHVGM
jgi:hypothetical protein